MKLELNMDGNQGLLLMDDHEVRARSLTIKTEAGRLPVVQVEVIPDTIMVNASDVKHELRAYHDGKWYKMVEIPECQG